MVKDIKKKEAEPLKKTGETFGDTIVAFLNKTASKDSYLKVDLDNLTVGEAPMQAKLNGTVELQVQLAKE
jgi:hypothetical protein